MCLYPRLILNKKYTANQKNGGIIPAMKDDRVKYVPVGCQNCMECRKQKAREWQVRLLEDIKSNINGKFITLTFNDEHLSNLATEVEQKDHLDGYNLDNAIATLATRRFLERWRKKYKISLRHWLITELGHNGTENIHLHGIIWTNESIEEIKNIWQYGFVWPPKELQKKNYVNAATVNYITKYVTKRDEKHTLYKAKILTSQGIGNNYTKTYNAKNNKYRGTETREIFKTSTGHKMALPIYWRNKLYNENEREQLWLNKLDNEERWVDGQKVDISKGDKNYYRMIQDARNKNRQLGYGDDQDYKDEERKQYERQQRNIQIKTRIAKAMRKNTKIGALPQTPHRVRI